MKIPSLKSIIRFILFPFCYLQAESLRFRAGKLPHSIREDIRCDKPLVLYVRNDFWLKEGNYNGAVSHTVGIVNALQEKGYQVVICTPYRIQGLPEEIQRIQPPGGIFTGISELEEIAYNRRFRHFIHRLCQELNPCFIYQRHGRNSYAAVLEASRMQIPLISEYNGSEVWMSRHWGRPLQYERITQTIEKFVLSRSSLVVGNAQAFREELIRFGVAPDRILITPNGVSPNRFLYPERGASVRERFLCTKEDILVTFIGSFGRWHGTDILSLAARHCIASDSHLKFLFIGQGPCWEECRKILQGTPENQVFFTGPVPSESIPDYLFASDILVSPQVPNPDGTPFFGSPTKIFEYMCAGKAIIASNLGQLGHILADGETAILTIPGEVKSLEEAICRLKADAELREKLGAQAKREVLLHYTWDKHLTHILDAL
ncbi:MAG: glycosyltransferase family 4 protein [Bacteroidales bacterium]|nr:glycosyltransferase family 4 protein [Bacteroidales bacterium]